MQVEVRADLHPFGEQFIEILRRSSYDSYLDLFEDPIQVKPERSRDLVRLEPTDDIPIGRYTEKDESPIAPP